MSDGATRLAVEIQEYCAEHADPKQALKYARFFTEGYDSWGLVDKNHPIWHEKQEEWLERHRSLGLSGFLKLGALLFRSGKYEEGGLAIRFVAQQRDQFNSENFRRLDEWFEAGIRNWAQTDVLCGEVIAPLLDSGKIGLEDLASWRESKLKFQRRAVPVSMLELLKSHKKAAELLDFIRPLMLDPERVVQQGLGWFLRESWKKHPKQVESFLHEWKDEAPRLIFQYATEKMTPAERARFRREKKR